jgi:hypothetical protein
MVSMLTATASAATDGIQKVALDKVAASGSVVCPLCGGGVNARGCPSCHLSLAEIGAHSARLRRGPALWTRFIGLVVYLGLVLWSWWFMPSVFLFVLPGALVGAYMQTVRARPLLGAVLFVLIVVIVPALLWPAGLTGDFSDLSRHL